MTKQILVVDDDRHIREVVQFALEKAGLEVIEAGDGRQALTLLNKSAPALVVLDITMPEMDGLAVCREIRKSSDVPILFLSSRSDEIDRVVGLEIGGDDYVSKPFSPRELVARVQTILKRTSVRQTTADEVKELTYGAARVDLYGHAAYWKDKPVALTATEFAILKSLLREPQRVFSRDRLMDGAYDGQVSVSDRTIDSHMRNLRAKYAKAGCKDLVETVHGVGYKLGSCR
ncbi:MAG TPA: response regulator transcription factor [Candidatus Binatia bacterium]|nr:response regulator transcription factor [Candidatus Binatia bacterium]